MKKITDLLQSKRNIAGIILLSGLIFTTYNIQENSIRLKRLTNFESGMQTCFTRVNQSYTAKILGDTSSTYLTQNFQNLTEECFAEGILNVEDSFKIELSQVAKKLSTLASNVHWFHEDIFAPASAHAIASDGEPRDVGARFEKIENTKDDILDASEQYKAEITNDLNKEKSIFYVTSTLLALVMLFEYLATTKRRLSNNAREKEADAELLDNGGIASVKVGEIIRSALIQNDLLNCSKLFVNYHAQQSFDKSVKTKLSMESLITPLSAQSQSQMIEKIWNDDNIGVVADNVEKKMFDDLNLEQMTSAVVNLLAEKLFSQGIQLNVNIADNITVKAHFEELEQTLYHLVNYAINSTHSDFGEKNISIFAHKMGDIVTFDLVYSGRGFDNEILKHRVGIASTDKTLDVDMQICQSLLDEIQAKIQLDNKINQNGHISGGRIKIIFKSGLSDSARLVDLKVGSKNEILAGLKVERNSKTIN